MKLIIKGKTVGDSYPDNKEVTFELSYEYGGGVNIILGESHSERVFLSDHQIKKIFNFLMEK